MNKTRLSNVLRSPEGIAILIISLSSIVLFTGSREESNITLPADGKQPAALSIVPLEKLPAKTTRPIEWLDIQSVALPGLQERAPLPGDRRWLRDGDAILQRMDQLGGRGGVSELPEGMDSHTWGGRHPHSANDRSRTGWLGSLDAADTPTAGRSWGWLADDVSSLTRRERDPMPDARFIRPDTPAAAESNRDQTTRRSRLGEESGRDEPFFFQRRLEGGF